METACVITGTLETFWKRMVASWHGAKTVCALPARRNYIDADYKRLRAFRRRADVQAKRKTVMTGELRVGFKIMFLGIWTILSNSGRWRNFCATLDLRQPLSWTWKIA